MRALHQAAEDAGITIVNEVRNLELCCILFVNNVCFLLIKWFLSESNNLIKNI